MTQQATDLTVRRSITVEVPRERAFAVFVERMGDWWPVDRYHVGEADAADAVLEPREGGRWYERGDDGVECDWGRVLAYEPPARLVLAWMIGPDWKFDPDPARATEVEVRFLQEGASSTRVELEHRGFEVHGDRAEAMRAPIASDGGWGALLQHFADATRS
jgi:uncharacterized protein YndB with AHSA1/START domain